ncbi:hypothetical protein H6G45_06505 [Synechocystis sp. FACHB-383]|uniref:hypothetical protein n=1 Tax=Synechocystis sp. FACHB-383 TaxID=2692864 RepID=UPI0016893D59|nr:hypothetical protein [Synechocystis sp. FACHB-383]MBD2653144.1 hypothetical protein [Synechocystis sp. FACHB-383]
MAEYRVQKKLGIFTSLSEKEHFSPVYEVSKKVPVHAPDFFWFCLNWGLTLGTFGIYMILYFSFCIAFFEGDPASKFAFPSESWEHIAHRDSLEDAIALVEELKSVEAEVYHF